MIFCKKTSYFYFIFTKTCSNFYKHVVEYIYSIESLEISLEWTTKKKNQAWLKT